jgi:hypothetical protein
MATVYRSDPNFPMTHDPNPEITSDIDCASFEERLMAYLECELEAGPQAAMEHHRASCGRCDALVRDLAELSRQASSMPPIAPSRDLWPEINARLETPIVPLHRASQPSTPVHASEASVGRVSTGRAPRMISLRIFALAATVLIAVTSVMTWQVARNGADQPAVSTTASAERGASDVPAALVANAGIVYEQEISALRTIVDERFTELDSATVAELRRNLEIIDRAILDSREALERDPASRVLSTTLDRALESKLALMRRVALL